MAEQYASIDATLKAALDRNQDAKEAYRTAHTTEMNAVADTMIERGPLPNHIGRRAFLFAMHGVKNEWRDGAKSPEQILYEEVEKRFGTDHMDHVFSLSTNTHHDEQPFQLFAYHSSQYDAWLRHDRPRGEEFSAVEYEVTKEYDTYVGRIAVPASAIYMNDFNVNRPDAPVADASTIIQTQAMIMKIKRASDSDLADVSVPFGGNPPEVRFGKYVAAWAEKQYGLAHYVKILENVVKAEKLLRASPKNKPAR